jgi:hypothetical protein
VRRSIVGFLIGLFLLPPAVFAETPARHITYADPIDALSVTLFSSEAVGKVRGFDGQTWTAWQKLTAEESIEADPLQRESNLILFPRGMVAVEYSGDVSPSFIHPIRISGAPTRTIVAAASALDGPHILSREEWGANEELRYVGPETTRSDVSPEERGNGNGTPEATNDTRVMDCEEAQKKYPDEFKVKRTIKVDAAGNELRWPQQYSKEVKLLAVHHTALKVRGDARSGLERMRALYEYHAQSRGWGDIGYHYVIDEKGAIYEGHAGGDYVVGGHAYCNNVGSIGVALMGNFDEEKPAQKQMQSLQWLLAELAKKYDIDVTQRIRFHGKDLMPIAGHRELVATACPGYYVRQTLAQVRGNVARGALTAAIKFPSITKGYEDGTASRAAEREERWARSTGRPPRRLERLLRSKTSHILRRNLRDNVNAVQKPVRVPTRQTPVPKKPLRPKTRSEAKPSSSPNIRIKLSFTGDRADILLPPGSRIGTLLHPGRVHIQKRDDACVVSDDRGELSRGVIRLDAGDGAATIETWKRDANRFRGIIECRVIDGSLVLINEIPLEVYMNGLAEEPDTEPAEKQRAFAIAARTYAYYYTKSEHRKFPTMPYDGSDNPAEFQAYGGALFEEQNPKWVEAVTDTANKVLTFSDVVIRPPYFSSDDGRTRSPEEAGWRNFPNADVFASKPDPWCAGMANAGHGVGMSGCGAEGQAEEGKNAQQILEYYYPGTNIQKLGDVR